MSDATEEAARVRTTPHTRTASYLAEPGEVGRVLLLYSGGLDTSVMPSSVARAFGDPKRRPAPPTSKSPVSSETATPRCRR